MPTGSPYDAGKLALLVVVLALATPGIAAPHGAETDGTQGAGVFVEVIPLGALDFGTVAQNNGLLSLFRTDALIGKYKIRAKATLLPPIVTLSITPPPALMGPEGGSLPVILEAAFNPLSDRAATAVDISGTSANVLLMRIDGFDGHVPIYAGYLYVYGAVTIGHVPVGEYLGMGSIQAEIDAPDLPCAAPAYRSDRRYYAGSVVTFGGAYAVLAYVAQEAVGVGDAGDGLAVLGLGVVDAVPAAEDGAGGQHRVARFDVLPAASHMGAGLRCGVDRHALGQLGGSQRLVGAFHRHDRVGSRWEWRAGHDPGRSTGGQVGDRGGAGGQVGRGESGPGAAPDRPVDR